MKEEVVGVVENGRVTLPPGVRLPEGAEVRITWEESDHERPAVERQPLTEDDVLADIEWATGKRFPQ